jgi:hypothetical protein
VGDAGRPFDVYSTSQNPVWTKPPGGRRFA